MVEVCCCCMKGRKSHPLSNVGLLWFRWVGWVVVRDLRGSCMKRGLRDHGASNRRRWLVI